MSIVTKISDIFKKKPHYPEKDWKVHYLIGRFVKQNNIDIGESIGFDGKRMIIKNQEKILSIPLEAVIKNSENIVVGDFDIEQSLRLGKEWGDKKDVLVFDDKGMMVK